MLNWYRAKKRKYGVGESYKHLSWAFDGPPTTFLVSSKWNWFDVLLLGSFYDTAWYRERETNG